MFLRTSLFRSPDGVDSPTPTSVPEVSSVSTSPEVDRDMENAARVFDFDPFEPPSDDGSSKPGDAPPEAAPGTPGEAKPLESQPVVTPPPAPTKTPNEIALENAVAELRGKLDGITQARPADPAAPAAPEVELPDYAFQVPEKLAALLNSEDPKERIAGMGHFARGVAQTTHQQVVTSMRQELSVVIPEIVNRMVTQRRGAEEVQRDFYGTYKEFDKPELRGLVTSVARQAAAELKLTKWSPQLRDETAKRVRAIVAGLIPAPAPTAAPKVPATPAPRMTQSGVRPGAGRGAPSDQEAEMAALL